MKEQIKDEKIKEKEIGIKMKEAKDSSWDTLLRRAGFAVALLFIAVIIILLSSLFAPSNGANDLQSNLSNQSQTAIKPIPIPQNTTCSSWLLGGGEKDSYSYSLNSNYSGAATSVSAVIESNYLGLIGGYNLRETKLKSTVFSQYAKYSSNADMLIYMDSEFKCVKMNITATVQDKTYSDESPCSEDQQMNFKICADSFINIKNETITVKAGTFQTKVYSSNPEAAVAADTNAIVWIAEGVDVPVKSISSDGEIELISYQKG